MVGYCLSINSPFRRRCQLTRHYIFESRLKHRPYNRFSNQRIIDLQSESVTDIRTELGYCSMFCEYHCCRYANLSDESEVWTAYCGLTLDPETYRLAKYLWEFPFFLAEITLTHYTTMSKTKNIVMKASISVLNTFCFSKHTYVIQCPKPTLVCLRKSWASTQRLAIVIDQQCTNDPSRT